MSDGTLFIPKSQRPDVTHNIGEEIYGEDYVSPSGLEAPPEASYPGVLMTGCKEGSDGKEDGSDGKEDSSRLPDEYLVMDDLDKVINLAEIFRPELRVTIAEPVRTMFRTPR